MRVAIGYDPMFTRHIAPAGHPERQERLSAARRGVSHSLVQSRELPIQEATYEQLARVHTPEFIAQVARTAGHTGEFDADTYYCPHSYVAALRASGAMVALVEQLANRAIDSGFVLARPPGHHARPDQAMGFCLFNHVAVAAAHALAHGVERVAILDWDVHHGNGTEEIFYEEPRVLYLSLHESPQYPGTGRVDDTGPRYGDQHGTTVNVPLSAGADDNAYLDAFDRLILPVVEQFGPELVLVSAGYDAHQRDPLGGMSLTASAYAQMTARLLETLPERGRGRFGLLLEGGYDLSAIEESVMATCNALVTSPPQVPSRPGRWSAQVDAAIAVQRAYWALPQPASPSHSG